MEEPIINTIQMQAINFASKKVLIVEDNNINLWMSQKAVAQFGIMTEHSTSGTDFINKIRAGNTYDLILLDDMMPDISGTEALKTIKADPNFNMPVVVLTANTLSGMREKYLDAGFDAYLAKPIEKSALYQILCQFLVNK